MRKFLYCLMFLLCPVGIFAAGCKPVEFINMTMNKGTLKVQYQFPSDTTITNKFNKNEEKYLYYVVFASNNGNLNYGNNSSSKILESNLQYGDVTIVNMKTQDSIPVVVKKNPGKVYPKSTSNGDVVLKHGFTGSSSPGDSGSISYTITQKIKYKYIGVAIVTCAWSASNGSVSFEQNSKVSKMELNKNPPSISMKDITISDSVAKGGKYYTSKNSVQIKLNSGQYKQFVVNNKTVNGSNVMEYSSLQEGENKVELKVVDYLFNESNVLSFSIVKDTTGPDVKINFESDYELNNSVYESPNGFKLKGIVEDRLLNAELIVYNWTVLDFETKQKINEGDYSVKGNEFIIQQPGKYIVHLESKDYLGNIGKSEAFVLEIKRVKPVVKNITLVPVFEKQNITKIEVVWESDTEDNQISYEKSKVHYRVKNETDDEGGSYSELPIGSRDKLFIDLNNLDLNRNKRNLIEVGVELASPYGISSDEKKEVILIPAKLKIETLDSFEENKEIHVSIKLSNTEEELADYEEIYISRLPHDKYVSENLGEEFYKEKLEDTSVNGIKTDVLPVSLACGHQYINYGVTGKIKGIKELETQNTRSVMLPNTKGYIEYEIKDSEGSVITLNTPEGFSNQNNLTVNKDGKIYMNIKGFDYDGDEWALSLYRLINLSGIVCKKLEVKKNLLENKEVENIGLLLDFGNNSYVFEWQEKNKQGDTEIISSVPFSLEMSENPLNKNGYLVKISNAMGVNTDYVKTRPGEELIFETESGEAVDWYFGDGSMESGAKVVHKYHQNENQQTSSFVYKLEVQANNNKLTDLSIRLEDTQQCALLENEVWRGEHFIYGTVIVPEGIKLEVQKSEIEETTILLENSNYEENPASLRVHGTINIEGCKKITLNNGVPKKTGIFIESDSENVISKTSVSGLERGIIVKDGCNLLVKGTLIDSCEIGIHNFGLLRLIESTIENNYEYGIKDEYGASLLQDENNKIENNAFDHYLIK